MKTPKRPWSEVEFLRLLSDQALLYRAKQGYCSENGEWPDEEAHKAALVHDAYWLFAVIPPFLLVLLEECEERPSKRIRVHTSSMQSIDMQNIMWKVRRHIALLADWFIDWACFATVEALCFSPLLAEPVELRHNGRAFRISRTGSHVEIEYAP